MPWIHRTEDGHIQSVYEVQQPGYADEFLPDSNPEVLAFVNADAIRLAGIQQGNAEQTALRTKEDTIAEIARKIALGAPQAEINNSLLQLLKGA